MGKASLDCLKYARCIDCRFFGTHGAYCDIQDKQELCFSEACVFFQWKKANILRHMEPGYFWPNFEYYTEELILRGMQQWVRHGAG